MGKAAKIRFSRHQGAAGVVRDAGVFSIIWKILFVWEKTTWRSEKSCISSAWFRVFPWHVHRSSGGGKRWNPAVRFTLEEGQHAASFVLVGGRRLLGFFCGSVSIGSASLRWWERKIACLFLEGNCWTCLTCFRGGEFVPRRVGSAWESGGVRQSWRGEGLPRVVRLHPLLHKAAGKSLMSWVACLGVAQQWSYPALLSQQDTFLRSFRGMPCRNYEVYLPEDM